MPDLAVFGQRFLDAFNAPDFGALADLYAPNAVVESMGMGVFEGRAAIRAFMEEWIGAFEGYETTVEEGRYLGNGVIFGVVVQRARVPGSDGRVAARNPNVSIWADGLIERSVYYTDIEEARAAAERLAKERG